MIVAPYKLRPVPKPLALLTADNRYLLEDGTLVRSIEKGVQAWAEGGRVTELIRAGKGRAVCWRGQPIRYAPDSRNFKAQVLQLPFPEDAQALAGLRLWRDWLAAEGAAPMGSLGSSSFSLLRATLTEPLWTGVPVLSCPPLRFTIGGRQELGPGGSPAVYAGTLRHFDMRAAYPSTMGKLEYGGHWFRLHADKLEEHARWFADSFGKMVFVRAKMRLSGSRPGPLVRRPRKAPEALGYVDEYPSEGVIQGLWTWPELQAAAEYGADYKLLEGWFHNNGSLTPRPFERWWKVVQAGRRMSGLAGLLAKATGSALWGQFCISEGSQRQLLYYDRAGRRRIVPLPGGGPGRPRAHDLSEYLTGSVRSELYRFMAAAGGRLCCAHTDGGWVDATGGWGYAPWRSKEEADRLRVLNPQLLAYRRIGEPVDEYVVAGWPAEGAREMFEREWAERARLAA